MNRVGIGSLIFFFTLPVWAETSFERLLNQVTLQLTADKWIKTATPLITIGIDASINDSAIGDMQRGLLNNLKMISSSSEWHITTFNRSEDPSGLEKIQAFAEARLPESQLAGLRDRVKKISRPGETYTLVNVAFTPTEAELRAAGEALRTDLYQQSDAEIARLNKTFPDQKYYLHQLNFSSSPDVQPMMAQEMMYNARKMKSSAPAMPISNHMVISGTAVFAAAPGSGVMQLVHGRGG